MRNRTLWRSRTRFLLPLAPPCLQAHVFQKSRDKVSCACAHGRQQSSVLWEGCEATVTEVAKILQKPLFLNRTHTSYGEFLTTLGGKNLARRLVPCSWWVGGWVEWHTICMKCGLSQLLLHTLCNCSHCHIYIHVHFDSCRNWVLVCLHGRDRFLKTKIPQQSYLSKTMGAFITWVNTVHCFDVASYGRENITTGNTTLGFYCSLLSSTCKTGRNNS